MQKYTSLNRDYTLTLRGYTISTVMSAKPFIGPPFPVNPLSSTIILMLSNPVFEQKSVGRQRYSMLFKARLMLGMGPFRAGFDSIKIIVDDNGFTGKGGPMKGFADIAVEIV